MKKFETIRKTLKATTSKVFFSREKGGAVRSHPTRLGYISRWVLKKIFFD